MRRRFVTSLIAGVVFALALMGANGPRAVAETLSSTQTPIFPGLNRSEVRFLLDDGKVAVANILTFSANDPSLELRGVLGQDKIPGLETVLTMGKRVLPANGVAGINAGFWLKSPVGDPNGLMTINRTLISEAETQGAGPRGTFARRGNGSLVMDRLGTKLLMRINGLNERPVTALNRFHRATQPYPDDTVGPVYFYTPHFGATVTVNPINVGDVPQPVRIVIVDGLRPQLNGSATGRVVEAVGAPGQVTIPRTGVVVAMHGTASTTPAAILPGDEVTLQADAVPSDGTSTDWDDVVDALAAGPLIVRRGERVDPASWESEGFAPKSHSNVRHPRSAVGLTFDGRVMLITVDGRQPGYSAGMTMHELAHFLRTLGVKDGLSLDGGGSSQFVTDGVLRNRPCCDANLRPVATGLFVFHRYAFTATERLAGSGREATAAQVALAGYPAGSNEVVIAAADNFPDALAGGPLAHLREAPLLLTGRDALPSATSAALATLKPQRITILGGLSAVSQAVENTLRESAEVARIAGASRIDTAIAVARALGERHPRVFLARADQFPDALSASGPAGALGMPILLTGPDTLSAATAAYLKEAGTSEVIVLGGLSAIGETVSDELRVRELATTRLSGISRFGTAAAINRWLIPQLTNRNDLAIVVAPGGTFADALAGGPLAARRRQLLMLAPTHDINSNPESKRFFDELGDGNLERVTLIGGHGVLSSYAQWQLDTLALR